MFFWTGLERVRKSACFLVGGEWNLSGLGVGGTKTSSPYCLLMLINIIFWGFAKLGNLPAALEKARKWGERMEGDMLGEIS